MKLNNCSIFCKNVLLSLCIGLSAVSLAGGQTPSIQSQITGEITSARMVKLPHTTHPLIQRASDAGRLDSRRQMQHMLLVLRPSAEKTAALKQYLDDQQNTNSANYHHWLTATQYGDQYGPSAADADAVKFWLQSQGMVINSTAASRRWIDFSGSVGSVEQTFRTTMHNYTVDGMKHVANATDISLPAAVTSLVSGVVRLNDIYKPTPVSQSTSISWKKGGRPVVTASSVHSAAAGKTLTPDMISADGTQFVTPGDLQQIYNTASLAKNGLDGTGVSIAVIGRSNVQLTDMQSFRQIFNLPAKDPQIILVGPDPGTGSGDEGESALDLEYAGALAPNANIKFVIAQSTDTADGVDLAAAYAVDNMIAPILSESYGECEQYLGTAGNQFYESLWQQAASEGISVLISTGDSGAAGCDATLYSAASGGLQVSGLASTPYNTAVGGTMFDNSALSLPYWRQTNSLNFTTATGYAPETTWNEVCDPTLPVVASGNCSNFSAYPRWAYYMLYGGAGGASSCTESTVTVLGDGSVSIACTNHYAKPSWQAGIGVPADAARDIPDVSLTAAGGVAAYVVCLEGSCQYAPNSEGGYDLFGATAVGGTSASTPAFAGAAALLNQKYGAYQGLLNYKLYQLANTQNPADCSSLAQTDPTQRGACIFHDITTGTNAMPCVSGTQDCALNSAGTENLLTGYDAGAGYDEATGLGSVDVSNLVKAWNSSSLAASSATFAITPTTSAHGTSLQVAGKVAATTGGGVPSGAVTLKTSSQQAFGPFPLTNGSYSSSISDLPGGTYTVIAHYPGDASYAAADSSAVSVNISSEASTTTAKVLTYQYSTGTYAAGTTAGYGDNLLLRADVVGVSAKGYPTGSLTLSLDGSALGTYTLSPEGSVELYSGSYTNPGIFPSVGTHRLTASYAGDSSFNASKSGSYVFTIAKATEYSAVSGSNYAPYANQQIVLTGFVVTSNPALPVNPTGTVQFYDNGVAIGSPVALATAPAAATSGGSQATLTYAFPSAGMHQVSVIYAGDSTFSATTGSEYTTEFDVTNGSGVASQVTSSTSSMTPALGQAVNFTISIAPKTGSAGSHTPSGTVTLSSGTSSFSAQASYTVSLVNGGATLTTSFTEAGSTPVFFAYSGDSYYAPSSGTILPLVVQKIEPGVSLAPSATLLAPGTQLALQMQIVGSKNSNVLPMASGRVQFYDSVNGASAVLLGSPINLAQANGLASYQTAAVATLATSSLAVGSHSIYGVYAGDGNYLGVTTTPTIITVSMPDFAVTVPASGITLGTGSSGSVNLAMQSLLGFTGTISVACDSSKLPAGVQCSISPATLNGGGGSTTVTLTAATPGAQSATIPVKGIVSMAAISFAGLFVTFFGWRKPARMLQQLCVLLSLGAVVSVFTLSGCGGSGLRSSTLAISSSASKAAAGSVVTLSASVDLNQGSAPTGSVTFYSDSVQVGQPAAVIDGVAKLDVDSLAVGIYTLTASYSGDKKNSASTSTKYLQAITGDTTARVIATSGSFSHTVSIPVHID